MNETEYHQKLDEANMTTLHLCGVAASGKRTLASHIREWHGQRRQVLPYNMIVRWSKDELDNAHGALHEAMR